MPTFMRYVAFLSTDVDSFFLSFFFFYNRQNIQKKCTTLCDPNSATDVAAKRQQWARSCCSCSLKHSWGILVFGFYATYIVSRSKPFTSSDAFCFLFFFPAWLSFFLEPRSHMLVPSKLHCHIQADEGDDTRRTSGCDMHTHTHTPTRTHAHTQLVHNTNAPERMKDRVGCSFPSFFHVFRLINHAVSVIEGGSGTYHAIGVLKQSHRLLWSDVSAEDV